MNYSHDICSTIYYIFKQKNNISVKKSMKGTKDQEAT